MITCYDIEQTRQTWEAMASRRSPAPTFRQRVQHIVLTRSHVFRQEDKKPCFLDKKTGRHDVRVRDEEYRIYFAITDLADSSEAPPLREQFSERSTNSVILISDFVHVHKI
mgnify:CR=1 FL=1